MKFAISGQKKFPDRVAIESVLGDTTVKAVSFGKMRELSNKLANFLVEIGTKNHKIELELCFRSYLKTAIVHTAIFKVGAISVPLFTLFGEDALIFRLNDAEIKLLITNQAGVEKTLKLRNSYTKFGTNYISGKMKTKNS